MHLVHAYPKFYAQRHSGCGVPQEALGGHGGPECITEEFPDFDGGMIFFHTTSLGETSTSYTTNGVFYPNEAYHVLVNLPDTASDGGIDLSNPHVWIYASAGTSISISSTSFMVLFSIVVLTYK